MMSGGCAAIDGRWTKTMLDFACKQTGENCEK
jgi:hypothetical protein